MSKAAAPSQERRVKVSAPLPNPMELPKPASRHLSSVWAQLSVVGILGVALFFHLWGIGHDLPYVTEDPVFAKSAVRIAGQAGLNPGQFAHPGSTLMYPLAAIYKVWHAATGGGRWLGEDRTLLVRYETEPGTFLLIGRLLTVVYALLGVLVVYLVGREAFSERTALLGTLLAAVQPTEAFDKSVRTDSASLLFCMLALWCCLRLYRRLNLANQLVTGAAIGLAIGTKYYLGTLVAVLVAVDAILIWRQRSLSNVPPAVWWQMGIGLLAVPLAFAVSTPYFFIEVARVRGDLTHNLAAQHVGADGLSRLGNLYWYLTVALPDSFAWPQRIAVAVGMGWALWERRVPHLLLAVFCAAFLMGISVSSLHWARWLVPVLPVFAIFSAHGLTASAAYVSRRLRLPPMAHAGLVAAAVLLCVRQPVSELVRMDQLSAGPSTSVLARMWVEENLPVGSAIAYEWDTLPPPLKPDPLGPGTWINRNNGRNLSEISMSKLSVRGTLSFYTRRGYHYLVTSSIMYVNYPAMPEQYPAEAAFYKNLLTSGQLLHQVDPSPSTQGSQIRIYEVR